MKKTLSIILSVIMIISLFAVPTAVNAKSKKPYINYKQLLLKKGQKTTLKLKNSKNVKWSSSDKKLLTVSKKGVVKAKKAGKATVTAKYKGKKYKCSVTVSGGKKKILVVYFSATNTTKKVAEKVKKAAGADIIRLVPKTAYTSADLNYDNENSRATYEQNHPSKRPAIATGIKNLKQYKTVFIGYPIWWGKEPRVIRTFLDKYSMKNKTVIPFCTSGSSGISGSMSGIKAGAKGAVVKSGKVLTDLSQSKVTKWVKSVLKASTSTKNTPKETKPTEPATQAPTSKSTETPTVEPTEPVTEGSTTEPATQAPTSEPAEIPTEEPTEPVTEPESNKTLVVYFSRTGNTKPLAQYASEILGADIFEIEAAVPYTDADIAYYTNCRADQEQNDPTARPEISGYVESMDSYSTIILAYPIWHGQAPKIIYTFLESYDFSGKTIIPFCTSASSGIGSSASNLHSLAPDAIWEDGRRFPAGTTKETIAEWLSEFEFA